MRIIYGGDDRELAAEMFNLESGARVMGPDFERLPLPHAHLPILDVAPVTKQGVAFQVHYRPALGVVFYVQARGDTAPALARRAAHLLESAGYQHLATYRAAAVTPAAVMRRKNYTTQETALEEILDIAALHNQTFAETLPARRICYCIAPGGSIPPCCSIRAVFTWVFLPIDAAFYLAAKKPEEWTANDLINVSIAGLVYDGPRLLRGDMPRELSWVTAQDFEGRDSPEDLAAAKQIQALCGTSTSGALVFWRGKLRFTGRWAGFCRAAKTKGESFPPHDWPDTALQCDICSAPFDGVAMLLRGAKRPANVHHCTWYDAPRNADASKLNRGVDILLCVACSIPRGCVAHMGAAAFHCKVPLAQSALSARLPAYRHLAPLLEGEASRLEGVTGAFAIKHVAKSYVVIGAHQGAYPAIRYEAVAKYQGLVIPSLNIVEVPDGVML